jgi:hypothetical protein
MKLYFIHLYVFMVLRVGYFSGKGSGSPIYSTFDSGMTFNAILYLGCMDSKGKVNKLISYYTEG